MKKSPGKLWRRIGGQNVQNFQNEGKMSEFDLGGSSRKKSKTKLFISHSEYQNQNDPRFCKLDISEIKKSYDEVSNGEVTNKFGWNQSENLDNLLCQFSSIDPNNWEKHRNIKQDVPRDQIQLKFRQTCKMFNSIMKSLKLQISMLKNITLKELQKQQVLQTQFSNQFQKVRRRLQGQILRNKEQTEQSITAISKLKQKLLQKEVQQKKLLDEEITNKLQIAGLIQQIDRLKQKNCDEAKSLAQEKNKIIQANNQLKTELSQLHQKIYLLNTEIQNKKNSSIGLPNLKLQTHRSQWFPAQPPHSKQNFPRNSSGKVCELIKHPSLQNYYIHSRVPGQSDLWLISEQQGYPEIAVSQIYRSQTSEENDRRKQEIKRESLQKKRMSSTEKKTLPFLRSSINLQNYKSKSPKGVGEMLSIIKSQFEDEMKILKSSMSTNS